MPFKKIPAPQQPPSNRTICPPGAAGVDPAMALVMGAGAGAGHIIPAQPPGKQGPSYPVPNGCPSGEYPVWDGFSWRCVTAQIFPRDPAIQGAGAFMRNETPPDVAGQPPSPHPGCYYVVHAATPGHPAWTQYVCP